MIQDETEININKNGNSHPIHNKLRCVTKFNEYCGPKFSSLDALNITLRSQQSLRDVISIGTAEQLAVWHLPIVYPLIMRIKTIITVVGEHSSHQHIIE